MGVVSFCKSVCSKLFLRRSGACTLKPGQENIILATFNVRVPCDESPNTWGERSDRCRKIIADCRFDIFGVQEAKIEQIRDLLKDTGYGFIGGGRNDFREDGEFSAIFYNRKRFEVIKSGTFGLSENPDVPGCKSWGAKCPRIATYGLFLDRISGKKFIYYNTHLDHVSSLARVNGVKMLVEHASGNAAGLPLVISGDFNARPDSDVYRTACTLLHDSAAVSRTPHQGPGNTFHGYGQSQSDQPIDYIFVSGDFTVHAHRTVDALVNGMCPSDHYPVIAELSIAK